MSNRIGGTVNRVFFTSANFSAGALVRDDSEDLPRKKESAVAAVISPS